MAGKKKKSTSESYEVSEHVSVSVRKIDNGFLVSKSKSGPKGYESNETYHPKRPKIDIQSIPHVGAPSARFSTNETALRKAAGTHKVRPT